VKKQTYKPQPCSHPGCTAMGEIHFLKADEWMCHEHVLEHIHSPVLMELTAADEELADHLEEGGKLS
jgi:hypothetical protein